MIFVLILSSLFIASCSGNNPVGPVNIYTGTQGVTVQFTKNNPPLEIYESSEMLILAEIWNKGAFTPDKKMYDEPIMISINVDDVYLEILGKPTDSIFAKDEYMSLYLSGKSTVWPIGEKTIIPIVSLKANKILGTRETPTTRIEISACYQYKTYFAESICIDSDLYGLEKTPICKNKNTYTYSGQGAPVIVNKMDVDMIPVGVVTDPITRSVPIVNSSGGLEGIGQGIEEGESIILRPNFRIYFQNAENGVILASNEIENPCTEGPASKGEAIRISAMLGNIPLTCARPEIKMYSNEGSVRCWIDEKDVPSQFELNRNYELPLKLEAEYFYKVTTIRDVRIMRVS
jgi:hypothetical protein